MRTPPPRGTLAQALTPRGRPFAPPRPPDGLLGTRHVTLTVARSLHGQVLAACKKHKTQPTEQQAALLALADELRNKLVQVDVHEQMGPLEQQDGYVRPALASTEARLHASATANFDAARATASA